MPMLNLLFDNGAAWFAVPALVGTGIFILRLIFMLSGGAHDLGLDIDPGVGDLGHHGDADPGSAFKALSFQGISAFAMGFGWGGLGGYRGMDWSMTLSLVCAIGAGVAMVWTLALLLKAVYDLQSSGNVAINDALGAEGDVYVGVPARGEGRGQVRVVLNSRQRIYNAVSDAGPVPSQARVRVTAVNQDNTLTVSPV